MRTTITKIITCTLLASAPIVYAEGEHNFSGGIAISTDYVFRGVSQSHKDPAISGSFSYEHASGLYAGLWASSIEFNARAENTASIETDLYIGFTAPIADSGFSYDVGVMGFLYPDQSEDDQVDYDYWELYSSLTYEINEYISSDFYYAYSHDFFAEDGQSHYVAIAFDVSLPMEIGLSTLVGHQQVEGDRSSGPDGFSYSHWQIGIAKSVDIFDFNLSYHDALGSVDDCGGEDCDSLLVLSVASHW